MSEHLDRELRRLVKQGPKSALEHWEFTPVMREQVLERIKAEAAGASPEESDAPVRPNRLTVPRPVMWVAVAAATAMLLVKVPGMIFPAAGGAGPRQTTKASMPAGGAAVPASPQDAVAPFQAGAEPPARMEAANPADRALAPAVSPAEVQSATRDTAAAPSRAIQVVVLRVPEASASGKPSEERAGAQPTFSKSLVAAAQPVQLQLAATVTDAGALFLSGNGLRFVTGNGQPGYEQELTGLTAESRLAVAPDGRAAVSAGRQVTVLQPSGAPAYTFELPEPPSALEWSPDGRLAAVLGSTVAVFKNGQPELRVERSGSPGAVFSADGALAVTGPAPAGYLLSLYDHAGSLLMEAPVAEGSRPLFAAGGTLVVAGSQAFDRSGNLRWQMAPNLKGAAPLGGNALLGWSRSQVSAVSAETGADLWRAAWEGEGGSLHGIAAAPDGSVLAVVAALDTGAAVWVLDQQGTIRFTERLPALPAAFSVAAGRLLLAVDGNLTVREYP